MSWTPIDNEKREKSAIGRFEIIAERYIFGNERDRNIILSFFDDKEKEIFLRSVGLYHLFCDQRFLMRSKKQLAISSTKICTRHKGRLICPTYKTIGGKNYDVQML